MTENRPNPHVLIAGGGIAAIEALIRLRRLAGPTPDITLIAPNEGLVYRPLSVREPFAWARAERHPLKRIARDHDALLAQDRLAWVDPDIQVAHTEGGLRIEYDALLLALGARPQPSYPHATVFNDAAADATLRGLVQDVEEGYTRSVAFLMPEGPTWPLPLYELALMTAERARDMCVCDLDIAFVTPEPAPLAIFGDAVSDAVVRRLEEAGIDLYSSATAAVSSAGHVLVQPQGVELAPGRIVTVPRLQGPSVRGIPSATGGFIPIDRFCRVPSTGGRVFAAGDGTAFPVKHGGVGAQLADVAAGGIAALIGADVEPKPFHAQIRGVLLTGREPLFISAKVIGGQGFDSSVQTEESFTTQDKVAADELGAYLAAQVPGPEPIRS